MLHQGSFLKIQLHDLGFKDTVIMGEVVFSCTDGWVSKFDGFVDMVGAKETPGSWRTSFNGVPVLDVQILYDGVDHHPIVPSAPPGPDPVDVASVQGLTPGPDSVQGPAVQGLGLPSQAFQGYDADFQVDYGPSPRSEVQGPSLRSEVLRSSDQGLDPCNGTQIVIKDDLVLGLHSFRQSDCPQQFMQNSSLGITDNEESWWIASTGTWSPPRSNRPRRRVVTPPSPQAYCHTTCQLTYSSSCLHFASALSPIVWR